MSDSKDEPDADIAGEPFHLINTYKACPGCGQTDKQPMRLGARGPLALLHGNQRRTSRLARMRARGECKVRPIMSDKALVCARAEDATQVKGSIYTHTCSLCGARVAVAPTGQRLLKKEPDVRIICTDCATTVFNGNKEITVEFAGSREEIEAEMRSVEPNLWRKRN